MGLLDGREGRCKKEKKKHGLAQNQRHVGAVTQCLFFCLPLEGLMHTFMFRSTLSHFDITNQSFHGRRLAVLWK